MLRAHAKPMLTSDVIKKAGVSYRGNHARERGSNMIRHALVIG